MINIIEFAYQKYCRGRFDLPSEAQISASEEKIGVDLPKNYRDYILTYNGGLFLETEIMPPDPRCPVDRLTHMSGIGATVPVADLASSANLGLFDDNQPAIILPIGSTIMGNLLVLITDLSEDRGSIFLKTFSDYFFLADNIYTFFGLLCDSRR